MEIFSWLAFIFIPIFEPMLIFGYSITCTIISILIYAWKLLWHPNGRSILDMLRDPEGNSRLIPYDKCENHHHWQERARPVPHWARHKRRLCFYWSKPDTNISPKIRGYDLRLCMFSYYQIHPTSINKTDGKSSSEDGITADISSSTNSIGSYWNSPFLSGAKMIRKGRPKQPTNRIISAFLIFMTVIGIFSILTGMTCRNILAMNQRSISLPSEGDISISCEENIGSSISEGDTTLKSSFSSEGDFTQTCYPCNCESESEADISIETKSKQQSTGSHSLYGFTASFADVDTEQLNTQIHFDTDSVFFVCDNSTTGHICKNIRRFVPGSLCQTNKSLTTANGTGSCLQEGIIRLNLINDNGTKHVFVLDDCLYHPDLPVNLLSTRRLAEKFLDASGNPDEETRIKSRYSTHVLIWSFGQFRKTFPTPISGLPELLFDEGFREYKSFCSQIISSYANLISSSDDNTIDANVIPFEDDEVHDSINEGDNDINTLFMLNESITFKDGKGFNRQVTYLGPHILNTVLKHKIWTQNDTEFFVDGILLSPLNALDISTIPATVEQYVAELPKLTRQQLEQISNPQTLDDDQRELMTLHFKMNHLPLPAMITLAENNKINRKFAKLKHRLPICMSCIFGTSHCKPWRTKGAHGSI
jgi:hypothetical protein